MIFTSATSLPCPHGRSEMVTAVAVPRSLSLSSRASGQRPLALVEKTSLYDTGLVLGGYLDVRWRQQEHLVGHALDAPSQPEDQAGREVDQALRVAVDHLGQVHDHRSAVAEMLPDRTGLIVRTRMQGGNPGQVGGLHHRARLPLLGGPAVLQAGVALAKVSLQPVRRVQHVALVAVLVILVRAIVVLVAVVVAVIVLYEAEIDRHLAHRAGHAAVLRRAMVQPRSHRVPRVGHYLTNACRPPSNAVPTRTCVAPAAIACSRSPLIPAEIITDNSASAANAAAGGTPSGATAISPPSTRPSWAAIASATASI